MRKIIALLLLAAVGLTGCTSVLPPTATPFQLYQGPTAVLPTPVPSTAIPPTNTRVMADPWTPTPIPTSTPLPSETLGLVVSVLSPETVKVVLKGDVLNKTYVVRLLGVDAPPNTPTDPWGIVAFNTVNRWLSGRVVRLVQDTTVINSNNELPRYLYLEGSLVNLKLIEKGLAAPQFSAPDQRLQSEFETAAQIARDAGTGIWGPDPTATPTRTPTTNGTATVSTPTATIVITPTPVLTGTPGITATPVVTATTRP